MNIMLCSYFSTHSGYSETPALELIYLEKTIFCARKSLDHTNLKSMSLPHKQIQRLNNRLCHSGSRHGTHSTLQDTIDIRRGRRAVAFRRHTDALFREQVYEQRTRAALAWSGRTSAVADATSISLRLGCAICSHCLQVTVKQVGAVLGTAFGLIIGLVS